MPIKQFTFFEWLIHSEANISQLPCDLCYGNLGFFLTEDNRVIPCDWCAKEGELKKLKREYKSQLRTDKQLLSQLAPTP